MSTISLLRDERMSKSLFKLGMPVVIAMLIMALYNVIDTFWVAQLGTIPIAAVSVAFPLSLLFTGIGLTFGVGGGAYISRLLGQDDYPEAGRVASVSIITAFLLGLLAAIICNLFLNELLFFMGANGSIITLAKAYGRVFILSCVIGIINITSGNIAVSQGASKVSGIAMVIGAIVNMGLDPIMIYTLHFGVNGAASATIISQVITLLVYLSYFKKSPVKVSLKLFRPTIAIYIEIIKIGISMLFFQILQTLSISLLQKSAVKYGSEAVAAIGIVLKIVTLGTNVVFGFVKGFQPMAGYNYGASNYARVKKAIKSADTITTSFCVIWSIVLFAFTTPIVQCFGDDTKVQEIAKVALRANTIMFFTFGFQFVYSTLYMAMGKAGQSFLLNISRQGIFFIPTILILPRLYGLDGVLYTQAVADALTTVFTLFFAVRVHKKLNTKTTDRKKSEMTRQNPTIIT